MKQFTLVTDLDNTLIGDNNSTLELNDYLLPNRDRFYLIYATGRSFDSVAHLMGYFQLLTHQSLLTPDYLISSVGTMIYDRSYPDQQWNHHISKDWNRSEIELITNGMAHLKPQSQQNPWKLSFDLTHDQPQEFIDQLKQLLASKKLLCNIIFSNNKYLDIIPHLANKGMAICWIHNQLDISNLPTLVCGDSGNDIGMYEHNFWGVVVGNAQSELAQWHKNHPSDRILQAKSNYASAILEGLKHFELI